MTDTQTSPDWSAGSLASVLPSVADRLGVSRYAGHDVFDLPAVPRTVVVLVDGLGHDDGPWDRGKVEDVVTGIPAHPEAVGDGGQH